MTKMLEVYKCEACGNIVEVLHAAGGDLNCCGHPMKLMKEGTTDGAKEKHVPVIEKIEGGFLVKVGSVAHPMEEKHWVEWIELVADGISYRKFLKPGDTPEAKFKVCCSCSENAYAREYCNLHGHWRS
ncbi:desulfoferrodoxin [Desulfovibrio litoralis]|uniref:Desulfoferrodoxin n=1 Tax=Desulfovibrio litoralis DSM 11393 TaxID=1121455 RepID=A0A1M7S7S0_9BACT|nr:desulfoferrodoxin [Desulfovibrio litoralis]SHN54448.1 superoxide reductase [Desulfovibrio litoralis DSM 11393]